MTYDVSSAQSVEQARYRAISKGWPALYLALCGDLAAVAFVHSTLTPWYAWVIFPIFALPKAGLWLLHWRDGRHSVPSTEQCARAIRFLEVEVVFCVAMFVGWEIWLTRWGTVESLILLALCMGGQMVFILFGLLHLRLASVVSAGLCAAGLVAVAASAGANIVGIVLFLTCGVSGLAYFARCAAVDFTNLVKSRLNLEHKASEIMELSEQNFRLANTDALTEVGNRRRCFRDLEQALATAKRDNRPLAFAILDLDGFKAVNDSNGHVVGDRLLHAMAVRIQETLGDRSEICRLGGDEFAFILEGEGDEERLVAFGDELIASVHLPIFIGEHRLMLGCSVGFATFPRAAETVEELYDRADYALFHAKRTGRSKAVVFSEEHEKSVRENALIERSLRAADLEAEFFLTFQPIVDSHKDKTMLLECLARWQSPVLGFVSPGKFIVVAEQSGFISTLTPVLLEKALRAVKQWPDDVGISFNLSGHDIVSSEKVLNLIAILMRSGVSPKRIEFEVTETAIMMNLDQALANLHLLKGTGARISLDDFGTGYSSLSQIQKLPLDKIKVDGSFVRDLESNEASRKIVSSVSALSRDLSLSCVVEGVETREQLDILNGIGCSLIQGYFYSKPMREEQVEAFLEEQLAIRTTKAEALAS